MTTATTLRNIIAIMGSIDRHEIARAIDPEWWKWADVHYDESIPGDRMQRQASLDRADRAFEAIARIVSARMAPATQAHVLVSEPVAWQPKYKQEVIDHHRSVGSDLWEYAMTVYQTKEAAENYGYGGHEARPLYAVAVTGGEALRMVVEYDDLLRTFTGPIHTITASDNAAIDAAYDKMVAAARAALSTATPPVSARMAEGVETVHPDDLAVDRFAVVMKVKLAEKRAQGYGGWDDPTDCTIEWLSELLRRHIEKGDPVDVGNFAMMIHQRGGRISE